MLAITITLILKIATIAIDVVLIVILTHIATLTLKTALHSYT